MTAATATIYRFGFLLIILTVALLHLPASAQDKVRISVTIGETEKNDALLNLAGNSTRLKLEQLYKDLWITKEGGDQASRIVLFAIHVRGDEIVGAEASEPFEIKVRYTPGEKYLPLRKLFGKRYPTVYLVPQQVEVASVPTAEYDISSEAYGLVAPRRDGPQPDRLKSLILKQAEKARAMNDASAADVLVLFTTATPECGSECIVEQPVFALILGD